MVIAVNAFVALSLIHLRTAMAIAMTEKAQWLDVEVPIRNGQYE